MQVRAACTMHEQSPPPPVNQVSYSGPRTIRDNECWRMISSVMGNTGAFAVRKEKGGGKTRSCYMMLLTLDCWWIATSCESLCNNLYWKYMIRAVSERMPGGGCLIFSYTFQATSLLCTFFFERRNERPLHLWKNAKKAQWPRDLFPGYEGHRKEERGGGRKGKGVQVLSTRQQSYWWWFSFEAI